MLVLSPMKIIIAIKDGLNRLRDVILHQKMSQNLSHETKTKQERIEKKINWKCTMDDVAAEMDRIGY